MEFSNPFECDAAANLPLETLEKIYIEDHNNSRFILSNRNVFLLGERGSGKSMMLIYNSFKLHAFKEKESDYFDYKYIGVHVPCKRPLFNKSEFELIDNKNKASLLSEHYLVLTILYSVAEELSHSNRIKEVIDINEFYSDFEYLIGSALPTKDCCFKALKMFTQNEINKIERTPKSIEEIVNESTLYTFHTLILPVIELLRGYELLENSHFMIMIDDAHDLNEYQIRKINSWISYRDHSAFSMKIATADVYRHSMETDFGGCIVDGHDYMSINMEKSFQNPLSPFHKLAKQIIERRLSLFVPNISAEEFFPENPKLTKDLLECKNKVKKLALERYPTFTTKQLNDFVYKKSRVEYFRNRDSKANRPPYSGFEVLVNSSTGVVRNLLAPCFAMYDRTYSENGDDLKEIPPRIQEEVLIETSDRMWAKLRSNKLSDELTDCSENQAIAIRNFFENLGDLFTKRLKEHNSEPRVITFSISGLTDEYRKEIDSVFDIARKALLLYERSGPSKDSGRRETYYVPNRMLWLARGLDPVGQHGRVSLPAKDILGAFKDRAFPYVDEPKMDDLFQQQEIGFE